MRLSELTSDICANSRLYDDNYHNIYFWVKFVYFVISLQRQNKQDFLKSEIQD